MAPDAEDGISYRVLAFRSGGKDSARCLTPSAMTKGSLHFEAERPLPSLSGNCRPSVSTRSSRPRNCARSPGSQRAVPVVGHCRPPSAAPLIEPDRATGPALLRRCGEVGSTPRSAERTCARVDVAGVSPAAARSRSAVPDEHGENVMISLRIRAGEDRQAIARHYGTSVEMLERGYSLAIEDLEDEGPKPVEEERCERGSSLYPPASSDSRSRDRHDTAPCTDSSHPRRRSATLRASRGQQRFCCTGAARFQPECGISKKSLQLPT